MSRLGAGGLGATWQGSAWLGVRGLAAWIAVAACSAQGGAEDPRLSVGLPIDEQIAAWRAFSADTFTALPFSHWPHMLSGPMRGVAEERLLGMEGGLEPAARAVEALAYLEALRMAGLYEQLMGFERRYRERWPVEGEQRIVWDLLRADVLRRQGWLSRAGAVLGDLRERVGARRDRWWIQLQIQRASWLVELGCLEEAGGVLRRALEVLDGFVEAGEESWVWRVCDEWCYAEGRRLLRGGRVGDAMEVLEVALFENGPDRGSLLTLHEIAWAWGGEPREESEPSLRDLMDQPVASFFGQDGWSLPARCDVWVHLAAIYADRDDVAGARAALGDLRAYRDLFAVGEPGEGLLGVYRALVGGEEEAERALLAAREHWQEALARVTPVAGPAWPATPYGREALADAFSMLGVLESRSGSERAGERVFGYWLVGMAAGLGPQAVRAVAKLSVLREQLGPLDACLVTVVPGRFHSLVMTVDGRGVQLAEAVAAPGYAIALLRAGESGALETLLPAGGVRDAVVRSRRVVTVGDTAVGPFPVEAFELPGERREVVHLTSLEGVPVLLDAWR